MSNPKPSSRAGETKWDEPIPPSPEKQLGDVLDRLGLDLTNENLAQTPRRFLDYLREFMQPFDPAQVLNVGFGLNAEYHGMVAQARIPFRGICAHHLLPYIGHAAIGYVPSKRVVGLSKLSRLVECVGLEKPSLQEHQTDRIADILMEHLDPKGVIVVISCVHTCMSARGVAAPNVPTITSTVKGVYRDVPAARQEFFDLVRLNHVG